MSDPYQSPENNPYPQQPAYPQGGNYQKPHRGTLILVLGILSIMFCGFFGIASWMMGNGDLREIDAGVMDPAGRDMTNIGRILGMVGLGLMVFVLVLYVLIFVVMIGGAAIAQ